MGSIDSNGCPLNGETRSGRKGLGWWESFMDKYVNTTFAGVHERPGRTCITREAKRQTIKIKPIADSTADAVDDRKRRHFHSVRFVDNLRLAEIELRCHDLLTVRIDGPLVSGVVPCQRFLDGCAEVFSAQAGFGTVRAPHIDWSVSASDLGQTAAQCDQVAGMVGV